MFYPNYETILIKYILLDPLDRPPSLRPRRPLSRTHTRAQLSRNGIYSLPRYDNGLRRKSGSHIIPRSVPSREA